MLYNAKCVEKTGDDMNEKEAKISVEHWINICIALLGVVLVAVGIIFFGNEKLSTIIISVGASLIASSIVAFLSSIYIQKYRRAKEISETWGIRSIEAKRATMNIRIDSCMSVAKKHYDIMAFGLKSLRDGNTKGVEELLEHGASIRILSVDPTCKALNDRDVQEKKKIGDTAYTIKQLAEWAEEYKKKYPSQFQIRFSKFLPSEFYCRVDNSIFVGPYQYGKDSQQLITLEYKNPGKAFSYYEEYFESLWADGEYCVLELSENDAESARKIKST